MTTEPITDEEIAALKMLEPCFCDRCVYEECDACGAFGNAGPKLLAELLAAREALRDAEALTKAVAPLVEVDHDETRGYIVRAKGIRELRDTMREQAINLNKYLERIDRLAAALVECCDLASEIDAYTPDYFREKWDHAARIEALRKVAEGAE